MEPRRCLNYWAVTIEVDKEGTYV
jgi:hypothetical protein